MKQADIIALIPETRDWNAGKGILPEDWISCVGNYELAIGYSLIFWPRFIEFSHYVLRETFSKTSLEGFEQDGHRDRAAIEAVMNHIHLGDLHVNAPSLIPDQLR